MANAKKIKLNKKGIVQLLQSSEMMTAIKQEALSKGKIVKEFIGVDRVHVIVKEGKKDAN